jgi:hypothetical protein
LRYSEGDIEKLVDLGDKIVDAAIALFILAFVGMLALTQLFQASTTSVPSTVVTLVTLLVGILFALGVALAFYRYLVKGSAA